MSSVEVFWGNEPEHQSEREFLTRLRADLEKQQLDALILANFHLDNGLQIDCLVVTLDRLVSPNMIEFTHYTRVCAAQEAGR